MVEEKSTKKAIGGRPKGDPSALRVSIIGVRFSHEEYSDLRDKAKRMDMTPAQWLRGAALSRRLQTRPVSKINRSEYANLARLSAKLNQLTKDANEGIPVTINHQLIGSLIDEVRKLPLAILGLCVDDSQSG